MYCNICFNDKKSLFELLLIEIRKTYKKHILASIVKKGKPLFFITETCFNEAVFNVHKELGMTKYSDYNFFVSARNKIDSLYDCKLIESQQIDGTIIENAMSEYKSVSEFIICMEVY